MSFTIFDKFGRAAEWMTPEQKTVFCEALFDYGLYGTVLDTDDPVLGSAFAMAMEDIDHSKSKRKQGESGGRPPKTAVRSRQAADPAGDDAEEPTDEPTAEPTDEPSEEPTEKPSEKPTEKPTAKAIPKPKAIQSNTEQYRAKQGREARGSAARPPALPGARPPRGGRFAPPTVEDVRAYAEGAGCSVDAERFVDYYASNGWKVGRSPMRDWRAAVRNWARRDAPKEATSVGDVYSRL